MLVRDQGLLLQQDRRLLDRLAYEVLTSGVSVADRDHAARPGRRDGAFGSRIAISFQESPADIDEQRSARGSLGRVGSCDNAAMESFFSLLQKNLLNAKRWDTREQLRLAIVTWIETK